MSRTRRKDYYLDTNPSRRAFMLSGEEISLYPTKEEILKGRMDKKKWYKPTKRFKKSEGRKDAAKPAQKLRAAIAHGDDMDGVVLPDAKRHHEWDWN